MLERVISNKADWTRVAFGEVVRLSKARSKDPESEGYQRVVGLEHIDPGDLRIRRWADIADGTSFTSVFQPGQVLFGKRRAYQRKLAVAEFGGVCSGDIYVLEPSSQAVMPELLPFICQTDAFFEHAISTSAGSLSPRTNWKSLASFEFSLPPIQEQARLVEVLAASQKSAEHLLNLMEATRTAHIALFEVLMSTKDAKYVELGGLMTESPRNGYSPAAASEPTGHWVLALSAISPRGYRSGQFKPVAPSAKATAALIGRGDLVVSRSNTRDLVGLPMVFPEERSDVSYPDTMMRISVDTEEVSVKFLEWCLRSPICRRQVQSYAAGTSSSMLKINGANIRKVEVPFIPMEDQLSILANMSAFTAMLTNGEKRFNSAREFQSQLANEAVISRHK